MRLPRRAVLAGAVLMPSTSRADGPRVVSLDYGLAQTLLALGTAPVGLPDPADYRIWVIDPALPPGVADLGGRVQPNLEVVAALQPDLILAIPDHDPIAALLSRVAPVLRLPVYAPGATTWEWSRRAAATLGARLDQAPAAEALVAGVADRCEAARTLFTRTPARPVLLASVVDGRHLRVYAGGSILQAGLDRMGLRNAWTGPTGKWGSATVPFEALARLDDAMAFLIEPLPPGTDAALAGNALWQALPFVRAGRVMALPPVLMFGTLPSVDRLATLLTARHGRIAGHG